MLMIIINNYICYLDFVVGGCRRSVGRFIYGWLLSKICPSFHSIIANIFKHFVNVNNCSID